MAADVTEPEPRAQPRKVRFSWRRFLVFLLLVALVLIIGRFTDSVVAELIFVVAALAILVGLTVSDIIKRRSSDRAGGDGPLLLPGRSVARRVRMEGRMEAVTRAPVTSVAGTSVAEISVAEATNSARRVADWASVQNVARATVTKKVSRDGRCARGLCRTPCIECVACRHKRRMPIS